jgi:hypothetical protein
MYADAPPEKTRAQRHGAASAPQSDRNERRQKRRIADQRDLQREVLQYVYVVVAQPQNAAAGEHNHRKQPGRKLRDRCREGRVPWSQEQ